MNDEVYREDLLIQNSEIFIYILGILIVVILCLAVTIAIILRKRTEHKAFMTEQQGLIAGLLYKVDSKRLQEEALRRELLTKTRVLTMLLLYLILKNQMLNIIQRELTKFSKVSDDDIQSSLGRLVTKATVSINIEKNWEFLKANLQSMNLDFLDRLASKYSNLTPSDLKLCSLLKNRINAKEIASSMEISRDSAKIAKHRLKRKLGLSTEEDLDEFLQLFDSKQFEEANEAKQLAVLQQQTI
jgi:DNA-binding CsgD family transcriptional regulator